MAEEETRARILNAAGAAFAEVGFEKATVREICRRADVNVAAVNYHFGDKERLYAEAVVSAFRYRIEQAPMPNWPPGTPAEQRFRDFVRTMVTRMLAVDELPWQEQLTVREMFRPTGACRELVEEVIRPHFELLLGILDELIDAETPAHVRQQLAFSVIGQCLFYRFHGEVADMLLPEREQGGHYTPLALAEHIADFSLAGLARFHSTPHGVAPTPVGLDTGSPS